MNITWTVDHPEAAHSSRTGRDEAGNTYWEDASRERVTCETPDGRRGSGWTPEEALRLTLQCTRADCFVSLGHAPGALGCIASDAWRLVPPLTWFPCPQAHAASTGEGHTRGCGCPGSVQELTLTPARYSLNNMTWPPPEQWPTGMGRPKQHKAILVLKALLQGHRVELANQIFAASEDDRIGTVVTRYKDGLDKPGEEELFLCDLPLNTFLSICEKMSDEEAFLLNADVALTDIKRGKGR